MDLMEKLTVLADAAKYDAACTSIGGCGALLSRCIKSARVVAYEDLGAEAIRELVVENFPAVVIIDAEGNNLYETGKADYLATID